MSPEELIAMGASPEDAGASLEELIARQQRLERRIRNNQDCSMDGRGLYLSDNIGTLASSHVAETTETK